MIVFVFDFEVISIKDFYGEFGFGVYAWVIVVVFAIKFKIRFVVL